MDQQQLQTMALKRTIVLYLESGSAIQGHLALLCKAPYQHKDGAILESFQYCWLICDSSQAGKCSVDVNEPFAPGKDRSFRSCVISSGMTPLVLLTPPIILVSPLYRKQFTLAQCSIFCLNDISSIGEKIALKVFLVCLTWKMMLSSPLRSSKWYLTELPIALETSLWLCGRSVILFLHLTHFLMYAGQQNQHQHASPGSHWCHSTRVNQIRPLENRGSEWWGETK